MFLYRISIFIYRIAISIASLWDAKARRWIQLRKSQRDRVLPPQPGNLPGYRIWMHVASLGEFEQGRPILDKLKEEYPEISLVVSFFSPSGFDRADAPYIDWKVMLPLDSPRHARDFLGKMQPDLAIFVKYEFWYHYLKELDRQHVPVVFVSALFRKDHWFFKPLFSPMLDVLRKSNHFFVQDTASQNLLAQHGISQATVAGDTRIDRVVSLPARQADLSRIMHFLETPVDLVCGSIWPADADLLLPLIREKKLSAILAPHELGQSFIRKLKHALGSSCVLYSELESSEPGTTSRILILDTIGLLSRVYRLGRCAYIGGGFGPGIHNTLEPAAYGIPVIFGPNYQKFTEAAEFIRIGAARPVRNIDELSAAFDTFASPGSPAKVQECLEDFFERQKGGTQTVFEYLEKHFLKAH